MHILQLLHIYNYINIFVPLTKFLYVHCNVIFVIMYRMFKMVLRELMNWTELGTKLKFALLIFWKKDWVEQPTKHSTLFSNNYKHYIIKN